MNRRAAFDQIAAIAVGLSQNEAARPTPQHQLTFHELYLELRAEYDKRCRLLEQARKLCKPEPEAEPEPALD